MNQGGLIRKISAPHDGGRLVVVDLGTGLEVLIEARLIGDRGCDNLDWKGCFCRAFHSGKAKGAMTPTS
jgi:hypothetical protein